MKGDFITARIEELPVWLSGRTGRAIAIAQGAQQNLEAGFEEFGVKERWPSTCTDDALGDAAIPFQIDRYPADTDDTFRARTQGAWKTWEEAGSPQAEEDQANAFGIVDAKVYRDQDGCFGEGAWYSRFWLIVGPTMPWSPLIAGSFSPGPNVTVGSTATPDQITTVRRMVLKWKSYWGYPVKVILAFPGVPLCGVGLIAGAFTVPTWPAPYCTWEIGKTVRDTLACPPFVCGGFIGRGDYFDR